MLGDITMKKRLMLFTSLLLTFTLVLAGCSGGKTDDKKAAGDNKTLTVSVEEIYKPYVESIKDKFEKDNDVQVKIVTKQMFDQLEAIPLDGPAGKAPDVTLGAYDRVGGLAQQGHLAEVKSLSSDDFSDKEKNLVTSEGKQYGVPAVIETIVMYYNKDLIKEAPKTFAELEKLATDKKFDFASESGTNTAFLAKWTDFYYSYGLLAGNGGYVFGKDGTDVNDIGLNNAGAVKGVEYAKEWYKKWPKGMLDNKSAGDFVTKQFTEGKTAVVIDGPWQAATYKKAKVNYGVTSIAKLPGDKDYSPFAGGKAWIATSYSKNPDLAQKWLAYAGNADNAFKFYEDTNEIPANETARDKAAKTNDELTNAVIDQFQTSTPTPTIPEMSEVWTGVENLMFDAVSGKKEPQASADAAVKVIKTNISEKYESK